MAYILDIAVILIFALAIFIGYRRGFVKSIIRLVGCLLALVIAGTLSGTIAGGIYDGFLAGKVKEQIVIPHSRRRHRLHQNRPARRH